MESGCNPIRKFNTMSDEVNGGFFDNKEEKGLNFITGDKPSFFNKKNNFEKGDNSTVPYTRTSTGFFSQQKENQESG